MDDGSFVLTAHSSDTDSNGFIEIGHQLIVLHLDLDLIWIHGNWIFNWFFMDSWFFQRIWIKLVFR
jgi:hypothetical protein